MVKNGKFATKTQFIGIKTEIWHFLMQTSLTVAQIIISIEEKYSMREFSPLEDDDVSGAWSNNFQSDYLSVRTQLVRENLSYNLEINSLL